MKENVGECAATALNDMTSQASKPKGLVEGGNVRGVKCIKIVVKTRETTGTGRATKKAERGPTLNVDNFTYPKSTSMLVIADGILKMASRK